MQELLGWLPQLYGLLEKGGIIGVLIVACGVLAKEALTKRQEVVRVYGMLDIEKRRVAKERMIASRYRTHLDIHKITVDISDILLQFKEDLAEEERNHAGNS